jgi:two-component system sensor histidine kinase YesM
VFFYIAAHCRELSRIVVDGGNSKMLKRFLLPYLLLSIVPFILLGFIVSSITGEMVSRELLKAAEISLDESYDAMRAIEQSARRLSLAVATDEDVQEAMRACHEPSASALRALERALRKYLLYNSSIAAIKVRVALTAPPNAHGADDGLSDLVEFITSDDTREGYVEARENPGHFSWRLHVGEGASYLRQCKAIYDMTDWKSILGYTLVDVNLESMRSVAMKANSSGSRLYLVEKDGAILYPYYNYDKIPEAILTSTARAVHVDGESMLLVRPVAGANWKLIKTLPLSDIQDKTQAIRFTIQGVAAVFMLLSLAAAFYYYFSIASPIARLARRMEGVQAGTMVSVGVPAQKGEIAELYKSYNYMIQRLREQIDRTYVFQLNAKEAELKALQAQINPHFLYNTLDSINWLALRYGDEDISEMVIALSGMLRLSLNRGETVIPLKDELRQVDSYVTLQKIRYSNRFDVHYDVDEGIGDCRVVKMLLQPLVENAIIHGFEEIDGGGLIEVGVHERDGMLEFEVSNNGALIDLAEMETRVEGRHDKNTFMRGYGIKNVNERLASHYGPQYKIVYSVRDRLTVAALRIPREVTQH